MNKLNLTLLLILVSVIAFNQYKYTISGADFEKEVLVDSGGFFKVVDPALASKKNIKVTSEDVNNYIASALVNIENSKKEEIKKEVEEKIIKPSIKAESWLAYNLTNKEMEFSHEPGKSWPTASLAKLVAAIVVVEEVDLDTLVTITPEAIKTEEIAGYFEVGEVFSAKDLVTSLFLVSSNDGAMALAESIGLERFISEMNKVARRLDMQKTFFVDPSGLSSKNISSAEDIKKLIEYIYWERPELIYFSRQPEASIIDKEFAHVKHYKSINKFAGQADFIGGKTGYIPEAGENLVSIFSKDNQAILIVVLGSDKRFKDTEIILDSIKL